MNFKVWLETNEVVIPKLFDKVRQLKGEYSGVHFSKTNQLSFNLNPHHYDPIGIYVFPKQYVLQGGLEKNQGFARNNYAFLIQETSSAKVLNLNINIQTAEDLLTKMGIDKNLLNSEEIYHNSNKNTPGHRFWGVLEHIRNKNNLSKNMSWNSFFNKIGYNALYDPGLGIVHYNEPSQIVYLDHKAYEVVDVIKNDNNYSLLIKFASFFPDFMMNKGSKRNQDEIKLRLFKKDTDSEFTNQEIYLQTSKYDESKIRVNVYGFELPEGEYSKEWYINIKSNEDLEKLVLEIKNFMKNSPRAKKRFINQKYKFIEDIAKTYKLRIDPEFPAVIEKKYKDNTKFDIKQSTRQTSQELENSLTLSVGKGSSKGSNSWINYFYYYAVNPTDNIEETIKMLFKGIKEKIQKDAEDENSRKKYDAPHALKFVEFLEKRVFVRRN